MTLARATSLLLAALASSTVAALAPGCSSSNGGGPETPTAEAGTDAGPDTDASGDDAGTCAAVFPTTCPSPAPTWSGDVEPIMATYCWTCHADGGVESADQPLGTYEDVFAARNSIRGQLQLCDMPPSDAPLAMPEAPRDTFLAWLKCGALDDQDQ